jgi:hypothetical protein
MSFLLCIYSICCNKLIIKLYYPHSKCGERVTAPWVRIPVSPLNVTDKTGQRTDKSHKFNDLWDFFYPLVSALKYIFSPLKDKVSNLTRTPDKQNQKGGTDSRKLANFCRCLASLHKTHF